MLLFVVISVLAAGFVYFSNFLNWLLGMTEDFPLFYIALGILAVLAKIGADAVPKTISHLGILVAIAAAAGIVGMVVLAPFVLLAQGMFAQNSDEALQWVLILAGTISSVVVGYLICRWGLRRSAVPQRPSPHRTTRRKFE